MAWRDSTRFDLVSRTRCGEPCNGLEATMGGDWVSWYVANEEIQRLKAEILRQAAVIEKLKAALDSMLANVTRTSRPFCAYGAKHWGTHEEASARRGGSPMPELTNEQIEEALLHYKTKCDFGICFQSLVDLKSARAELQEIWDIVNDDGSLKTHEDIVFFIRDGQEALKHISAFDAVSVENNKLKAEIERLKAALAHLEYMTGDKYP